MGDDLTVEILKQIRDGITGMRSDVNSRFESLENSFEHLREEVSALRTETRTRLERVETGLGDLGQFMRQIALDQTKYERFHAHHVDVIEKEVEDLRARVRGLEERESQRKP